jgi:hypothetical protein
MVSVRDFRMTIITQKRQRRKKEGRMEGEERRDAASVPF